MEQTRLITIHEQTRLSILAAECFLNDPYYEHLDINPQLRRFKLQTLFCEQIGICQLYGLVDTLRIADERIGFSCSIDYNRLRSHADYYHTLIHPKRKLHPGVKVGNIFPVLVKKYLEQKEKVVLILHIGVLPAYQGIGLEKQLLFNTFHFYPDYTFYFVLTHPDLFENDFFNSCKIVEENPPFYLLKYQARS